MHSTLLTLYTVWTTVLQQTSAPAFLQHRSRTLLGSWLSAWVRCIGRHTLTRMLRGLHRDARHRHDAYHRLLSEATWSMTLLWHGLARLLVACYYPDGSVPIPLVIDDTLFTRPGPRVQGAGCYRDAVRSSGQTVVYAHGLSLIIVALRIRPPWGGPTLALPIKVVRHEKGGVTYVALTADLLRDLAVWFPGRTFDVVADGAYAALLGYDLPHVTLTTRMRANAALFELPAPRRAGQRGRPAHKGERLPTPQEMARDPTTRFHLVDTARGERLVTYRRVLWYETCPTQQVLLVIVRDPAGHERDDFFCTNNLTAAPDDVVTTYTERWPIEVTNRDGKQLLGGEDLQTWHGEGPERAASLTFWLHSVVWHCYLTACHHAPAIERTPWYPAKSTPSFSDALAAMRLALWRAEFSQQADQTSLDDKINSLLELLTHAA